METLTPESEFAGFMHPAVEDALRRVALKKLFGDPRLNVPDPFDAYAGDWTGVPIPQEMLAALDQAQQLLLGDKEQNKAREPPGAAEPLADKAETGDPRKQDA